MRDCEKKAIYNYRAKCKQVIINFNLDVENDKKCYDALVESGNKSIYIKKLILEDKNKRARN